MAKKILLVEDEAPIAMNESQMLKKYGYEVVTAYKGEKALKKVDEDPGISLILMDIDLGSGIDGTHTAREILKKHDLPIIFLTGQTEEEYVKKVEEITSYGIIQKFSGEFILVQAIKMAFRLFETHQREKEKEQRLEKSENKFRQMFTQHSAMKLIIDPYQGGKITDANQAAIDFYGYSFEELTRMYISDINTLSPEKLQDFMKHAVDKEQNVFQFEHVLADGSRRDIEVHSSPIVIEDKPVLLSIMRDITLQKEAETALREKKEMLDNTLEHISDLVVLADADGYITFHSNVYETIGYGQDSLIGKHVLDLVHPEDLPKIEAHLKEFIHNREDKRRVEYRFRCADGSYIWLETDGKIVKDKEGNIKKLLFSARDITDRIKARKELQEKEQHYRSLFEQTNDGVFILDFDGSHIETNEQAARLLGYESHELSELSYRDVSAEPDNTRKYLDCIIAGEREPIHERLLRKKNGEIIPVEINVQLIQDKEGNPLYIQSVVRDISERKKTEEALKESEKKYRLITENASDIIIQVDEQFKPTYISPSMTETLGYTLEENGNTPVLDFVLPEDRKSLSDFLEEEIRKKEKNFTHVHRVHTRSGEIRWMETRAHLSYDDKERFTSAIYIDRDITDIRKLEEQNNRMEPGSGEASYL